MKLALEAVESRSILVLASKLGLVHMKSPDLIAPAKPHSATSSATARGDLHQASFLQAPSSFVRSGAWQVSVHNPMYSVQIISC